MARREDIIPNSDKELNDWAKYFCQLVSQKTGGTSPEWDHIPKAMVEILNNCYIDWYTAYSVTLMPHTPIETGTKNRARDALVKEVRSFINEFIRNSSKVSEEDKESIGIHHANPSPVPKPTAQVEADLMFPGIHLVELVKIRKVGNLPDDPRSDYGVRIYYGILDAANSKWRITAPPVSGEDLPHSVFNRKKKMLFDFDGESGKTVYFCLRYERQSGGEEGAGPFGPILHAVIP
jgi:hypothetical protein